MAIKRRQLLKLALGAGAALAAPLARLAERARPARYVEAVRARFYPGPVKDLENKDITIEPQPKQKLQSIGFFVEVPHLEQKEIEVNYTLPRKKENNDYQLFIQKQSGIIYRHTIEYQDIDGNQQNKQWIETNQLIKLGEK